MKTMQETREIAEFVEREYGVRCFASDVTDVTPDSPPWIQVDAKGFQAAYQGPCDEKFEQWLRGFEAGYHHRAKRAG